MIKMIPKTVTVRRAPSEIRRSISKYKVSYTDACIDCGLCENICPYEVHKRLPGHLKMNQPNSSNCMGPKCEENSFYCVPRCPYDAIRIELNSDYKVLGDPMWTPNLLLATWHQAETGELPPLDIEYRIGNSGGGFDKLRFKFKKEPNDRIEKEGIRTSIELNKRSYGARIEMPVPWYSAGMSFGSISLNMMLARAKAAQAWNTFVSTGEGGYPEQLVPYKDHIITQLATGQFGVTEQTIGYARIVEIKYAQGAKPGLGGHLLADKVTPDVAKIRESVPSHSLFSPFPFHSVYSVEDHKKHVDWIRAMSPNLNVLISAKVSSPTDVEMVAVGCYYAGVNIFNVDGSYGGTGAAPDISKKNIAMPIEYAIPKVHKFLVDEGIRDEIVFMASGGIRTAYDVAKAIALGADGVIIGTADLVACGCTRCGNCESGRGCPLGIATTDHELFGLIQPDWGAQRISNLYYSWHNQLVDILWRLDLDDIRDLRGAGLSEKYEKYGGKGLLHNLDGFRGYQKWIMLKR